jgi:alpha-galactosidase/6-phospho-beta-glucosidase family protein
MDDDVVVEVPGTVSGRGVQTVHVGALPKGLKLHILRYRVIPMEVANESLLTGDKDLLLNRILLDHRTRTTEQAKRVMNTILNLPFNQDLLKHFH